VVDSTPVALAYWRTSQEPQSVVCLPRSAWLTLCSGSALLLFLALFFLPLGRGVLWCLLVVLGVALLAGALLWPAAVPAVLAGCQPALAAIVLVLGVHWLLQERYRRQVVFIPGFTRARSGSSMVRLNGGRGRPRETSTIDAAPANGSEERGSAHPSRPH
jgi:hypothetical protein